MISRNIPLLLATLLSACGGTTGPGNPDIEILLDIDNRPIVFIGDSIVFRWGDIAPGVVNAGIGGNTTAQMRARFQADALDLNPSLVVIEGGINDLAQGLPPDQLALTDMVLMAQSAGVPVVLLAVLPTSRPEWDVVSYNQGIRDVALAYGVPYLDTSSPFANPDGSLRAGLFIADGVHLTAAGYELLRCILDSAGVLPVEVE